jgi:hypothetical protein
MENKLKNFFTLTKFILLTYFLINIVFIIIGFYFYTNYNKALPKTRIIISIEDQGNKVQQSMYQLIKNEIKTAERLNIDFNEFKIETGSSYFNKKIIQLINTRSFINKLKFVENFDKSVLENLYNVEIIDSNKFEVEFIIYKDNDELLQTSIYKLALLLNDELKTYLFNDLLSKEIKLKSALDIDVNITNLIPDKLIKLTDLHFIGETYYNSKSSIYLIFSVLLGLILTFVIHLAINIKNFRN